MGRRPPPPSGPTPLAPHFFCVVFVLFVLLLILLLVAAFLVACVPVAACCCRCFWCCLCLLLLLGPPTVEPPPLPPLQCLTFQNVNNIFYTFDWSSLTSTNWHKICRYPTEFPREDAPPPPTHPSTTTLGGPTPLALNFSGFGPHSGLLAAVVVKNTPLPLLTFQNVCTAFVVFCAVFVIFLLFDAGFSCCVLFFPALRVALATFCGLLLFMLLLLLLFFHVCAAFCDVFSCSCCCCCFCGLLLLLFGALCAAVCTTCCCLCVLLFVLFLLLLLFFFCFCLHCFAFSVVCPAFAAAFGSPTVERPTLAAFDLPKCQEQFFNWLVISPLLAKVNNQLL